MGQLIVPEHRLTAAGQRWGANEIVAQVGLQGTWRARLYRRHGTVEEYQGHNLILGEALDWIGSRFDTLGLEALTNPAYRFENYYPELVLGSNEAAESEDDPASVLDYVAHAQRVEGPIVTEEYVATPVARRRVRVIMHYEYTATGGEMIAELGLCHWAAGRYFTRSRLYDLAGAPVTVQLNAGEIFLVDYFVTVQTAPKVSIPFSWPEGTPSGFWYGAVGIGLLRQLVRYGIDYPAEGGEGKLYPWIARFGEPDQKPPLYFAYASWPTTSGGSIEVNSLDEVQNAGFRIGAELTTTRNWERLPYVPGSHQLTFAVSVLRDREPSFGHSSGFYGVFWLGDQLSNKFDFLVAATGVSMYTPRTDTYVRFHFTVSWGNA